MQKLEFEWLFLNLRISTKEQIYANERWLSLTNSESLFNGERALSFLLKNPDKHLPQLLGYLRNVV